jgi:hypothetical protein
MKVNGQLHVSGALTAPLPPHTALQGKSNLILIGQTARSAPVSYLEIVAKRKIPALATDRTASSSRLY